jgi:hypothetical protein
MPDGVNGVSGASNVPAQAGTSQAAKLSLSAGETKKVEVPSNGQPGTSKMFAEVSAKTNGALSNLAQKMGLAPKVDVSLQQTDGGAQKTDGGTQAVARDMAAPPPPPPPPGGGGGGDGSGKPEGNMFEKMQKQTAAQNEASFKMQMEMAQTQHDNAMMIAQFQGIRNEANRTAEALNDHAADAMTRGKNAQQKLSQSAGA